jgi:hypothetical protein
VSTVQGAVYDANCKYLTRNISEFQQQRYTMFLSLFIGNTVKYFGPFPKTGIETR